MTQTRNKTFCYLKFLFFHKGTIIPYVIALNIFIVFNIFSEEVFSQKNNESFIVVIDPGHGGKDPGTSGVYSKEKDVVLDISLLVGKYIEENIDGIKVIYTRKTDVYPELHERAKIANSNNANLFVSIHADGVRNTSVKGASTFVLGNHKSEANLNVAKRENAVILLEDNYEKKYENFNPKDPTSYMVFSLFQGAYFNQSVELAADIQNQFRDRVHLKDRGVKQAGFLVLWRTSMPSVLIETGFLTNPEEEKFLNSKQGQEYIASAIYRAIKEYKKEFDKKNNVSVPSTEKIENPDSKPKESKINSDIFFAVQLASSKNKISKNDKLYSNFNDIEEIKIGEVYKYTCCKTTEYSEAVNQQKKVRSIIPGAFIVARQKRKPIKVSEAKKLLKQ